MKPVITNLVKSIKNLQLPQAQNKPAKAGRYQLKVWRMVKARWRDWHFSL